ncbi:benzoate 4-monooxygenase cytochrome-like protein P450 [Dothidotthia symphoricarpi CBS 119687]|uniref:Benzoate 4-monooxygenase cytochrome-like protein P450 n=1 Tax=Dothidotthia symphoricarpi CBS 119687 TaxID=1392245 RepID=A0A6A6AT40_9PLEO|nr:benzoate 4-monooxygenase cytochrome-like protein P450 [Dothidotthia symphoricarpi CBS 119687]KAF2134348.1 benzoate 4-monooxygenase cytochrome-like protein P450 [Dothidotthia symphoricarpi CBS 119687]
MSLHDHLNEVSYPSLRVLGSTLVLSYIVFTVIYRLHFHPLAKFPGPFWARLTVFPSWWHTRMGDRHIWLYSLQEKYGIEFRYRPDSVLINTPSAYRKIFGPTGNVRKADYYKVWPRNVNTHNTWNTTSIDMHSRKRRVMNHAFSESALRSAEGFLHTNIDRWLELLGALAETDGDWTASLNMCDWMNWLVFDILGDLCFGQSFGMKEPDSKLRHVPEMMVEYLKLINPIAWGPLGSAWVWMKPRGLDWLLSVASPRAVVQWQTFVDNCLANRTLVQQDSERDPKPDSEVRKDFFYWLFKAEDPETGKRGYTLDELFGECDLLTIAGSDTTSIVLSSAFFYLARRPDVQAKLAEEILSTFSSYGEITSGSKIVSCKYLTAFLEEALRMTPPVSAEPARVVLRGGTTVDGHYISEGLHVSTGLYCLSFNKDVYSEPFTFRPERWIVANERNLGSSVQDVAKAQSAFCAFSTGSRGCVGKNLAWLEMRIVIAKTLWTFEVKADPTNKLGGGDPRGKPGRQREDEYQTYEMFVSNRKGPMVHLKKRVH